MTVIPAPARPVPEWVGRLKVTQWRVVVSEWTKLRSLRSTLWSLFVAVVFTIGLPCVFATVTAVRWSHMSLHERLDRHPLEIATAGVNLSQLAIGVLGVLIITGEYSTGMIRASLEEAFMDVTRDDVEFHAVRPAEPREPEEAVA